MQQRTCKERSAGHGSEHDEIIGALCLAAFSRCVAVRYHGGRADKAEIPADTEEDQRAPEMADIETTQSNDSGEGDQHQSERGDLFLAETGDELPVKKLGANMARTCHWMPSAA